MKESKRNKKYYFNNDDEFINFAIIPTLKATKDEKTGTYFADWEFSHAYKMAVDEGYKFVIVDEDSRIVIRQAITFRTITKNVEVEYENKKIK